jgi:predicted nuclease of predicted toxin-antitoxin system
MKLLFDQNLSFKLCQHIIWLRAGNQSTVAISTLMRRHADLILSFGNDEVAACLEIY